jgi:hypothetical protein
MTWQECEGSFDATEWSVEGKPLHQFVVEPLPEGGWSWTVWVPGIPPAPVCHGVADTAQDAMHTAHSSLN